MKNTKTIVLPAIFLIGFAIWYFPVNISSFHSWGGDFAQYIRQAIFLAGDVPKHSGEYILNPEYSIIGPAMYPNGFPLLLSGIYHLQGNSIEAFLHLISFFYILYALVCFLILKRNFGNWFSGLITLLIMLNPDFLHNKGEIISDVPFSVFFMTTLLLIRNPINKFSIIGIVLLTVYAIFTRSMAWSIVAGLILYLILNPAKIQAGIKSYWRYALFFIFTMALLMISFPGSDGRIYASLFKQGEFFTTIANNLSLYFNLLRDYFPVYKPGFGFIQSLLGAGLLFLGLLGFLLRLIKKDLISLIILTYFLAGIIYPASLYHRFFYPVLPFIFLFAMDAFKDISIYPKQIIKVSASVLIIIALYFNFQHAQRVKEGEGLKFGPQHPSAKQAFTFLENNVNEGETVNFIKPRVLALYANVQSISNHPHQKITDDFLKKYNIKWLMHSPDISNDALEKYLADNTLNKVYENEKMQIYRLGN